MVRVFVLLLWLAGAALAQLPMGQRLTLENHIRARIAGLNPPATCSTGQLYLNTVGTLYVCTSTNVWTIAGSVMNGFSDNSAWQLTIAHLSAGSRKAGINFKIDNTDLWQLYADNADSNKLKIRYSNVTDVLTINQGDIIVDGNGSFEAPRYLVKSINPNINFFKTDAPADQKTWIIQQGDTFLQSYVVNDVGGAPQVWLQVTRSGATVIRTSFTAGKFSVTTLPTFADNAAALASGLVAGDFYRTATGVVMVVY